VALTDPAGGDRVHKGGTVKLWVSLGSAKRTVPSLKGSTLEQAGKLLADKQLKLDGTTANSEYSIDVPEGSVISSSPAAGAPATVGDSVTVVTSKGPKSVPLEDVTGKTIEEATKILTDAGFTVQPENQSNGAPSGQVLWQEPKPTDSLRQGTTVKLGVSQGDAVTIPDLNGYSVKDARRALRDLGLQARTDNVIGEFFGGTVRATDPAANTTVPRNTTVTLILG
jgi:eukaryotic-like serine/threonine-protein kinase